MNNSEQALKAGIIGCGWFGRVHVERLSAISGVFISALSDPSDDAMEKLVTQIPPTTADPSGVTTYANYHDLLNHAGLDFVVICSPNLWHVEQIKAALDHGLNVLCEKPLTMIPSEVDQVVMAADKADKLVAIAYQSRYRKDGRALHAALASGKYGSITNVNIFSNEDWMTPNIGTWRHDPARCPGGFFGDANGHQLDFMFYATGLEADWVHASNDNRGTAVPINTWGESRLYPRGKHEGAGIPFIFNFVGDAHHWREEICISTTKVDFVMRSAELLWARDNKELEPFPESEREPFLAELEHIPDNAYVAALRGGAPVVSLPDSVRPVLQFTLAALKSAETGKVERAR